MSSTQIPLHTVLSDDDLRERILSFSENRDLLQCALVCRVWSDTSLDVLWSSLSSIVPLISILSPLSTPNIPDNPVNNEVVWGNSPVIGHFHPVDAHVRKFTEYITANKWDRFHFYARRVRHLIFSEDDLRSLSSSITTELLRKRPISSLAPNLKKLDISMRLVHPPASVYSGPIPSMWTCVRDIGILFMHRSLRELSVWLPSCTETIKNILKDIEELAPHLQRLTLLATSDHHIGICEVELKAFIANMKSITSISLSAGLFSPAIMNALSSHQELEELSVDLARLELFGISPTTPNPNQLTIPSETFTSLYAFTNLTRLSLTTRYENIAPIFSSSSTFSALKHLALRVLSTSDVTIINELLTSISLSCPSLLCLSLGHLRVDHQPPNDPDTASDAGFINPSTFQPLMGFTTLERLEICFFVPIKMSDSDFGTVLLNFPNLTSLKLVCFPTKNSNDTSASSSLTLGVLSEIAQKCRKLTSLAISLQHLRPELANELNDAIESDVPLFPHLEDISLTETSFPSDVEFPLAEYLSKICPPSCRFQTTTESTGLFPNPWVTPFIPFGDFPEVMKWSDVSRRMQWLSEGLRESRRKRSQHMKKHMEELESRIKDFELSRA